VCWHLIPLKGAGRAKDGRRGACSGQRWGREGGREDLPSSREGRRECIPLAWVWAWACFFFLRVVFFLFSCSYLKTYKQMDFRQKRISGMEKFFQIAFLAV